MSFYIERVIHLPLETHSVCSYNLKVSKSLLNIYQVIYIIYYKKKGGFWDR